MKIIQASDIKSDVIKLYEHGIEAGYHVGFSSLRRHYNVKLGCTTYYTGSPTSGKTELLFEILINLSEFYGWRHLIHTPETGSPKDIVAELAHKYIKKNFVDGYSERMEESELYNAINWIDEHFIIMDADDVSGCNLKEFLKHVDTALVNYDFQTITIDPWDELEHELNGLREDEYLKKYLSYIRRYARKNHIHFNIVAHPRTPQKDKNGMYLPATAYDISGGSKWYNKGEAILALHRPPQTDDGMPNRNMVKVMIQKAKPKEIGEKGVVEMYFDSSANRYYEMDSIGIKKYARKELGQFNNPETNQLQDKPYKDNDNGLPF